MNDIVHCEVCALPHRRGVSACEQCGHWLGQAPDWEQIRYDLKELRTKFWIGLVATLGMLAVNLAVFDGAGYILALAPLGWVVFSAARYRAIVKHLPAEAARRING